MTRPRPPDEPQRAGATLVRLADSRARQPREFRLAPDREARGALARDLGITAIERLEFTGNLRPADRRDWTLSARLRAVVVQPCVITLAPVRTRIDEEVRRTYRANWREPVEPESESPEDDTVEALPGVLDLDAVMLEALTLALPLYPRAPGAKPGDAAATPPGAAPLDDAAMRPFADLKHHLEHMRDAPPDAPPEARKKRGDT